MKLRSKTGDMKKKNHTPSQTVGPYFAYALTPKQYGYDYDNWTTGDMTDDVIDADVITIVGKVYDGNGDAIEDAMIEIWQDDGETQRFGRYGTGTDQENRFIFKTTKPQAVDGNAPFLWVIVFMRGQLIHSYTRMYFSDEKERNERDKILLSVPSSRRGTLMAHQEGNVYRFDIYMQGEKETVFFDV